MRTKNKPAAVVTPHPACGRCQFRVTWTSRAPGSVPVVHCNRFPTAVEVTDDYWCGEYREAPDAEPGNAGN